MAPIFWDCPFGIRDLNELDALLESTSTEELHDRIDTILQSLSPYELLHIRQHDFMSGAGDFSAAAFLIRDLWENRIIGILRIPNRFRNDAKVRKWLFAYEGLDYLLNKPELANKAAQAAVTDGLSGAQKESLANPRWEHADADRAKASPDVAAIGDKARLMASAQGFADNAEVAFDIFDSSGGSPEKIDSVSGAVDGGRAEAVWVVADPKSAGDKLDLQFEASAKDMRTEKASIKTKFVFDILLQIDVDDPAAKDDVLILLDENNAEVKKLPVKDMKEIAEDMVRIVIEDIDMDKKYTLIRDYGAEDDGRHDPLFVMLTPRELMEFSEAPKEKDADASESGGQADAAPADDSAAGQEEDIDHGWAQGDGDEGFDGASESQESGNDDDNSEGDAGEKQ